MRAGRCWHIRAEPDVMIRIKRIFPRVQPTNRGGILLSATPEVARDLEWVLDRWPMQVRGCDRDLLRVAAEEHRRAERRVQEALAGRLALPRTAGWVESAVPLRPYQIQGRDLVRAAGATLIVDELGLGKTATALALLEDPAARPALAVTLTALPGQWLRELDKFYPGLVGTQICTGKPHGLAVDGKMPDLVVISYSKLAKWQHHLEGLFNTVIFDEIQDLRRSDSLKYAASQTIAATAKYRTGLSATPVYNYGGEMYSIINVLKPDALGDPGEFGREWCGSAYGLGPKTGIDDPAALRQHLMAQGLFLRRTRADAGIDLPPIEVIEQDVPSDQEVLRKLEGGAIEMARLLLEQSATPQQRWRAAGDFDWQMRQITGISKAPFVADFVKLLLESQERVALFGWHRAVYGIWMERLADHSPRLYTGSETPKVKDEAVQAFVKGESRVLIMSLRSGAGLDGLQDVASTCVFGELDWSPGVHKQAIGRLGRPGQRRHTLAYFCTTNDGADPVMMQTLDIKAMQADLLIEPDACRDLEPVAHGNRIQMLAQSVLERHNSRAAADALALFEGVA
ncbi:SNF2-related protein [Candidatus Mycobacterium methanotrophicum]|uniref:DEAD/DEAH box helicase n=2 Tax=Candidatus Mycobacterium methanotrophicum TaxID=2943498 RepID=A0ABY4QU90_9MYCO|nr:DEAD/DEAH box helicase [Candidatus Mycobacterium methanotrophicum]UQX13563.1 DEAD/DEAH box helicase [Candidatus Mycobacterium methanotrophicum]